jgi:hypothetical protein
MTTAIDRILVLSPGWRWRRSGRYHQVALITMRGGFDFCQPCVDWCAETLSKGSFDVIRPTNAYNGYLGYRVDFFFGDTRDAMLFRLRWS